MEYELTDIRDDFELIDRTDNDCHDTGTRSQMSNEASARNQNDLEAPVPGLTGNRWTVELAGHAAANYRGNK